jgi:hypothetical protein
MAHNGEASLELTDTSARAEERYWERVRATPPRERLERALRLSAQVRAATLADVERQHPGASYRDLAVAFLRRGYGDTIADGYAARHPSSP